MRKDIITNFMLINLVLFFLSCSSEPGDIPLNKVVPSPQQIEYQQMELIGFIHFSINTFTGKEWGHGDESPELFNPTELNTEQWVQAAKDAGMKQLILTAKHHDGFCLWQSKFTEYSVKNSPWKNGSGDVVREFVDACRVHGLKAGLYLSPWDRNHPDYGKPEYLVYYKNQLTELLTEYGPISEIWFDGANGGDGYYGGANEERRIDRENYYNWEDIWSYVKSLQPNILIFSDAGPDIRWIGNENGFAGETNWSMINSDTIIVGAADQNYLNTGDPDGKNWVVGECDVSIRPGWFYHESEDSLVKSPQQLADIYFKSVGRNGTLLLNLPPNKKGLISENDIQSLREFRKILNETFSRNLALGAEIKSDNIRYEHEKFSPVNIIDGDKNTY
ncbi:MAG: alpha-L-fucosidase, partial [Melioribacteraceae bacterium]|nr:alpha-L-fucosidase [Melioribacteraceae bacterium]